MLELKWYLLQEKDARDIEIPNIRWEVFELMMRYFAFLVFHLAQVSLIGT